MKEKNSHQNSKFFNNMNKHASVEQNENPGINLHIYNQLIVTRAPRTPSEEKLVFTLKRFYDPTF